MGCPNFKSNRRVHEQILKLKFKINSISTKYSSKTTKVCVLKVDPEYPKKLPELHNNYPLAPHKIEIEKEILSSYQLKIAYFYYIPIGNVKKLVPNFFR